MNIFMLFLEMAPSVFKCIDTLYGCVELDGDPVEHQIWNFKLQCSWETKVHETSFTDL